MGTQVFEAGADAPFLFQSLLGATSVRFVRRVVVTAGDSVVVVAPTIGDSNQTGALIEVDGEAVAQGPIAAAGKTIIQLNDTRRYSKSGYFIRIRFSNYFLSCLFPPYREIGLLNIDRPEPPKPGTMISESHLASLETKIFAAGEDASHLFDRISGSPKISFGSRVAVTYADCCTYIAPTLDDGGSLVDFEIDEQDMVGVHELKPILMLGADPRFGRGLSVRLIEVTDRFRHGWSSFRTRLFR